MANHKYGEEEQTERILAYILDKLSTKERLRFEQEMQQHEELMQEVALIKEVALAYQEKNEEWMNEPVSDEMLMLVEDAAYSYQQQREEKVRAKGRVPYKERGLLMTGLILVLVAVGIYWVGTSPLYSTEQLFADSYETPSYQIYYPRSEGDLPEKNIQQFEAAGILYQSGSYKEAAQLYKEGASDLKAEQVPNEVLFYYSMCLLEERQTYEAIETLSLILEQGQLLRVQAEWYLALAYLQRGEKEEVLSVLNEIIEKDTKYADRAKELKGKIERKKWF